MIANHEPIMQTAAESRRDMIDHPPHYTAGEIECIDAIAASMSDVEFRGYLKGQVIKYLWRYDKKINPLEDLKKGRFYMDRLIKALTE